MKKNKKRNELNKRRIIEIIIIIIILLLITSCTAIQYFGKLGKYTRRDDINIDDNINDLQINKNDKLKFDIDYNEMLKISINSKGYKISYTANGIKPKHLTCTTNNADIATCIVEDGYIKIIPKKLGKVKVNLMTELNGKKYVAFTNVQIVSGKGTEKVVEKDDKKSTNNAIKSDATLKSLEVKGFELKPSFNKNIHNYYLTVANNVTKLNISAIPNVSTSAVSISGSNNLKVGLNEVLVKVTSKNGTTSTYKIIVNRLDVNPTDAYLDNLGVGGTGFDQEFYPEIEVLTITVDSNTYSLDLNYLPVNQNSIIEVTGNENFVSGINIVTIKVTNNGQVKIYTIIVNKLKDSTNTLSNLSVANYSLSPVFNENQFNYSLTVSNNTDSIEVNYTKKDQRETVEVSGNTNLVKGQVNVVDVKVTAEDGSYKIYKINVYRPEDTNEFYINSNKIYKLGYHLGGDNYKNIIINSNILNSSVTSNYDGTTLTLTDGESTITISGDVNLSYIESDANTHAIKVSYDSIGTKTLTVTGTRKGTVIDSYQITLNIENIHTVVLDANGGFFNEFSNKYEFVLYDGETLDLNEYNTAYKTTEDDNCMQYKAINYNTLADNTGIQYNFDQVLTVTNDIYLYVIYSSTDKMQYINRDHRLYLSEVEIFETSDGVKRFIYPGTNGSYIMHIENTTNSKITLKQMIIEEDTICVDNDCLNMGYIIKQTSNSMNNFNYLLGTNTSYAILNKMAISKNSNADGTYHTLYNVDLNNIVLNPGEETEISLLWKWVDSESDTKIGNYVSNNLNDTYYLTISYLFDKEDTTCEV